TIAAARDVPAPKTIARGAKSESDVVLPFDDPHPADRLVVERIAHAGDEAIDLALHGDGEPEIELSAPSKARPQSIAPDPPLALLPPAAERAAAAPPVAPRPVAMPAPVRAAEREAARVPPDRDAKEPTLARPAPAASRPEPEIVRPRAPVSVASAGTLRIQDRPTAFLDQGTDEFKENALEKTRSAIWPLALAIGV